MSETRRPLLSVVIPVFDEEAGADALVDRLMPVLAGLDAGSEVLFVDDGSRDRTVAVLTAATARAAQRWPAIETSIRVLARNFGQHAAICAGFAATRGRFVVTLDADLQNPPEEIPRLLAELRAGHDLVGTIRQQRRDPWFRRAASRLMNALVRRISGIEVRDFGCMLRGYSAEIAHAIAARREPSTYIPALAWLHARDPVEIVVTHERRAHGSSKYSLWRLFRLHLDLMTGFSIAPLRFLISSGACIAFAGILFGLLLLVLRAVEGPAWAADGVFTLFAILFFFVGAQFVAFGLLGEYIGRIFSSVRERPAWVVRETIGPREGGAALPAEPLAEGSLAGRRP